MPPQVSGADPGNRPVVVQSQDGVKETESGKLQKKPSENPENATTPSESHRATSKEKSQKNLEMSMGSSVRKTELNEEMHAKETKGAQLEANCQDSKTTKGGKGKGGDSWLIAIAQAMGNAANQQAEKVQAKETKPAQSKANSPEARTTKGDSFTSDSFNNVVKTIGEDVSTAARKQ